MNFQLVLGNFLNGFTNRLKQTGIANSKGYSKACHKLNTFHAQQGHYGHKDFVIGVLVIRELTNSILVRGFITFTKSFCYSL